jgi:hypothetical protein
MNRCRVLWQSDAVALFSTLGGCLLDEPDDQQDREETETTLAGTADTEQPEEPATLRQETRIPENGHVSGTLEGRLKSVYSFLGDISELSAGQGIQVGIRR